MRDKITKRTFLDLVGRWVLGGLAASAVLGALSPLDALAQQVSENRPQLFAINPVSGVVVWGGATVFIDPVGPQSQFAPYGRPDIVVLTHPHPDHLSIDTMIGLLRRDTVVLAPQAVINQLPLMISNNVTEPFEAGMTQAVNGISFRAMTASATIPRGAAVYPRSRRDMGVLIEIDGEFVYL